MRWLVVVVALTSVAHADNGPEAEAGFGAGVWNAKDSQVKDIRFAAGGHFDLSERLVLHAGLTTDLLIVETMSHDGLAELGAYTELTTPLQDGWSIGPRVSLELVEKPVAMLGVHVAHRPVSFGVDAVHLFADEKPTGVVIDAALTGKAGAWGIAIGAAIALLFAGFSRGNG